MLPNSNCRLDTPIIIDDCYMLMKVKSAASTMRSRFPAISLAEIQKHLAKIIILLPMALLLIYLVIFSQPRYMSESKVAIKRSDDLTSSSLNFGLLLGASNPSSAEDALYLKEYINSPDMLRVLDKQLDFHEAFSHSGLDFLNHLAKEETAERSCSITETASASLTTIKPAYWISRRKVSARNLR